MTLTAFSYFSDVCLPLYFRIEAVDSGGLNCFTAQGGYPCKVANAVEITVRHQGMTCGSSGLEFQVLALSFIFLLNLFQVL